MGEREKLSQQRAGQKFPQGLLKQNYGQEDIPGNRSAIAGDYLRGSGPRTVTASC